MKKYLLFILLILPVFAVAQIGEYDKFKKDRASFSQYISKNGDVLKVGDTLIVGKALDFDGFRFIRQGTEKVRATFGGSRLIINKMKSFGNKKSGFSIWFHFKGFGLFPLELNYENGLEAGEIINPKGKITKQQAIEKLKENKELLDLGVISQEEYENLKLELSKLINADKLNGN